MKIKTADFVISSSKVEDCPKDYIPEYAFIGRSNVGKSSLINMLTNQNKLAKTSNTPGKTKLINHFKINKNWYLVDLPGYGYARVSKTKREYFQKFIKDYFLKRKQLVFSFVLVDSRHEPQKNDMSFIQWLGQSEIPFGIVFTKVDKLRPLELKKNIGQYKRQMLEVWEEMPPQFITSSIEKKGSLEILTYIDKINKSLANEFG